MGPNFSGSDVAQRQQDVTVGIASLRVVADVRDHAGGDEHFSNPLAEKLAMNRGAQRKGKRDLHFPGELSVATVLDPIDGVPQRSAVLCPGGA